MTEEIFLELENNIKNPTVFDYEKDGVTYAAYSQSVPIDAVGDEIQYYIYLIVDKEYMQSDQSEMQTDLDDEVLLCILVILIMLTAVLALVQFIAWYLG